MSRRNMVLQITLWTAVIAPLVLGPVLLFGQRLTGQYYAWRETSNLRTAGANPEHVNPPAHSDSFKDELAPSWAFSLINGGGLIGNGLEFHNTQLSLEDGLTISQDFDSDFEQESAANQQPASQRYNNATLIGFQGYQPTPDEDVLFQTRMQVSPGFYGSAGIVVEPVGTILKDGNFQGRFQNQAFDLFGISLLGPESELLGKNGVTVERVTNWWPDEIQEVNVDMYQLHTYQLRLHWVNETTWQGIVSVDGEQVSWMNLPPFGPVEVQIWSDNYALKTSFSGTPVIDFQNGESKWVRFENISAWAEAVKP